MRRYWKLWLRTLLLTTEFSMVRWWFGESSIGVFVARFRKFSFHLAFLGVYLVVWGMIDGRLNNIAVEFHLVNVAKGEHRKPEFKGRCSFKSREVQAGAVIWCYHVGEMCNSLWVWKQLGVCAHGWDLSVCCSHQPIRKNPLYCWWVLQAGWKVRRISTLPSHTRAILRFEFCIHLWLFLGLSLCISPELKELSIMFLKRCLGWQGPLLAFWILLPLLLACWVDALNSYIFLCVLQSCYYGVFGLHTPRCSRSLVNLSMDSTLILFL